MTRFWHRRLCEVVLLLSVVILGLYAYPLFTNAPTGGLFGVGLVSAIAAGISMIASAIFYVLAPKEESWIPSFTLFLIFTVAVATLVFTTGGTHSPFIALWMLVAFFAGIFGLLGTLPLFILVAIFVAYDYLGGRFSVETIVTTVFSGILPIAAGLIVWHGRNEKNDQTKDFKKLSSELSEVASKSEVVINAIGDGVIAIDNLGIIQLINPAAQEMLGWGKQDALQLNYKSILQLTDKQNKPLDSANDPIQQALNTNQQIRSNELTIVTKTGKKIFGAVVVSPIGEVGSGVIAVFRDVTKEITEEREQAEFISTASHEMRTPVASIEGYLGLALNPQTSKIDDKAREFINKAHESAQHLGRLFQDLLDVSKSEDGRLANTPKVVDITMYIHDIVQGLRPKAQEKGLQLIYKPIPDNGQKIIAPAYFVNLDNDHIREVVNNLVENGIKYTPKGDVVVDVSGSDDKIVVSIKDTGIGIPTEDIPHLFQKFYRVDNVDTRQIGGTGLGLYLCRRLAETMGGRIWVESEYKKGSTFFLELPRIDTNAAQQLREQQEQAAKQAALQPATTPFVPPADTTTTPVSSVPTNTHSGEGLAVQAATTVPRGESLTREQIAAHVARLQAMAKEQEAGAAARPGGTSIPVSSGSSQTPPVEVAAPVEPQQT